MSLNSQPIQNQQNFSDKISLEQLQKSQRKSTKWILALLSFTEALSLKDSIHKTLEFLIAISRGNPSFQLDFKSLAQLFYGSKFLKNPDEYTRSFRRRVDTLLKWQLSSGISLIRLLPNNTFELPILAFLHSILSHAISSSLNDRRKFNSQITIASYSLATQLISHSSPSPLPKPSPNQRFLNFIALKTRTIPFLSDLQSIQKEIDLFESRLSQDEDTEKRIQFRRSQYKPLLDTLHKLKAGWAPSLNMGVGEGNNSSLSSSRSHNPISESSSIYDQKSSHYKNSNPYDFEDSFPDDSSQTPPDDPQNSSNQISQNTPLSAPSFSPEYTQISSDKISPEHPEKNPGCFLGEHPVSENVNISNNDIYENKLCTNVQIEHAEAMLKTLEKVGVKKVNFEFYIWVNDQDRAGRGKMTNLSPKEAMKNLPIIFQRNKEGQEISISIQDPWVIPLDDVKPDILEKIKPYILWAQESSPKNYHVLMAFEDVKSQKEREKILPRLKEALKTDKGGSRIKLAGVVNHKPKHRENPPVIKPVVLEEVGRCTSEVELVVEGILEKEEEVKREFPSPAPHVQRGGKKWRVEPYYEEYVARAPMNESGTKTDVSRADFAFCRAMFRRGFEREEVIEALMRESKCANGKYSEKTVKNALKSLESEGFFYQGGNFR